MIRGSNSLVRTLSYSLSSGSFGKAISVSGAGTKTLQTSAVVTSAPSPAPEKFEVFVDDIPVQVLPGTTVLQVHLKYNL